MRRSDLDLIEAKFVNQARASFWAFRQFMNPSMKLGWWQKASSLTLQQFFFDLINGLKPKLVMQAPPQHGKSQMIVDFIAWAIGHNPDMKTIYGSFSGRLGVRANTRLQRIMDSRKYRMVFPGVVLPEIGNHGKYLRNNNIIEMMHRDGYFRNTTVGGSITGESLDLGVIDDPIKGREEANSQVIRDKTWEWLTDDFFTRFSEDAGLLIILTRWHLDDPVGRLIERDDDVKVFSHSAIAVVDDQYRKEGEALFPEHKSLKFLLSQKKRMSEASWESIFQQNPIISAGNIFKPDNITVVGAAPVGTRWVRAWDFASVYGGGDWTAGSMLGVTPDKRYIIGDMVRLQGSPDMVEAALKNTAGRDGTSVNINIPQDPGQAGKSQVAYFTRQLAGFTVHSSPESGDKITRAEPFASQVNVGNVMMVRGEWNNALIAELRSFPNGINDDQVDALSRSFMELTGGNTGLLDYYADEANSQKQRLEEGMISG